MIRLTSCAKAHGVAKNQELVATASVKCAIGVVTRVESQDREGGEARRPKRPIPPQQNTLTKGGKQLGSSSSECGWAQQSNSNLNARGLGWGVDALRRWKGVGRWTVTVWSRCSQISVFLEEGVNRGTKGEIPMVRGTFIETASATPKYRSL